MNSIDVNEIKKAFLLFINVESLNEKTKLENAYDEFESLIVSSGLKISEFLPKRVLSLPMHPYLTIKEIQMVSKAVNSFVDNS